MKEIKCIECGNDNVLELTRFKSGVYGCKTCMDRVGREQLELLEYVGHIDTARKYLRNKGLGLEIFIEKWGKETTLKMLRAVIAYLNLDCKSCLYNDKGICCCNLSENCGDEIEKGMKCSYWEKR
jgi:hypothetical protein